MPQYIIPWWRTDIGEDEVESIKHSISSRHINQGAVTEELERQLARFLGVEHVVLTLNGSIALLMGLLACGITSEDEVIVPNRTFIASAQAAQVLGADIKIVDVQADRPLAEVQKIEQALTPKTKAIIIVHRNGMAADISAVNNIAKKHNIRVIEDCAQALGSKNESGYLGTQSDIGVFSLGITKLITSAEGGFVVAKDKQTYQRLVQIRNHGAESRYSNNFDCFGFNFKFNDVLASIGMSQIKKINDKKSKLLEVYNFYQQELESIDFVKLISVRTDKGELPLWIEVLCENREKLINYFEENNIQAKAFHPNISDSKYINDKGDYPFSDKYAQNGLILPCGPDQPRHDLEKVIKVLRGFKNT